jgi:hypothetical protein
LGIILYSLFIIVSCLAFLGLIFGVPPGDDPTLKTFKFLSVLSTVVATLTMLIGLAFNLKGTFQFATAYVILATIYGLINRLFIHSDLTQMAVTLALNLLFYLPIFLNRRELIGLKNAKVWILAGVVVGLLDGIFTHLGKF